MVEYWWSTRKWSDGAVVVKTLRNVGDGGIGNLLYASLWESEVMANQSWSSVETLWSSGDVEKLLPAAFIPGVVMVWSDEQSVNEATLMMGSVG